MLVWLLAGWLLAGCRTAERAMLGISRIKSPVTITTPGLNPPFARHELRQVGVDPDSFSPVTPFSPVPNQAGPRYDDYADLKRKPTTVVVCLSGGGARAARMAAHTFARLEAEFNERHPVAAGKAPLLKRIDAWSSVSGGSVYASFVAAHLIANTGADTNAFKRMASAWPERWGTKALGSAALIYYLWPGNLGYPPAMQVGTEWATLHLFARNLALLHEPGKMLLPLSNPRLLGDLPLQPRFFFNTTCRETARPLIITQSVLHRDLGGDPLRRLAKDPRMVWISNETANDAELIQPFSHAATLEDLGSPPNKFPLAFAAMASAAFPGVFEPLPLRHYLFSTNGSATSRTGDNLWWRQSEVTIVDGGVYDNTGLVTALQLFEHLRRRPSASQKLVVLAIDANNEPEGYAGPNPPSRVPWKLDLPLRGATSAVTTMAGMYESQQSLVMAAIDQRIRTLEQQGVLEYYAVRLRDAFHVAPPLEAVSLRAKLLKLQTQVVGEARSALDAVNLFGVVQAIPTDFVMSDEEDRDLQLTVEALLNRKRDNRPSVASGFLQAITQPAGPEHSPKP